MTSRSQINAHLNNKDKLEALRNWYFAKGQLHMSMTHILEELIDREFKRLELCATEAPSGS